MLHRRFGRRRNKVAAGVSRTGTWAESCRRALSGRRSDSEGLLNALGSVDESSRAAAERALKDSPPQLWLLLDRFGRRDWGATGPASSGALRHMLRSLDADGRVREAAVRELAGTPGPLTAPALALRTADWVEPVRRVALAAVLERTGPEEAAATVRVLLRLRGRQRAQGVVEQLRAVLAAPAYRRTVRRLAADRDAFTRRFGVELALELGEYVRGDLVRTAQRDPDQVCRQLCATRLLELDPDQAGRLMWARSAAVRELAVAALPDDIAPARLVVPLADRSRLVRAQARWKLYKRGEPPVGVYRRQLRRCGRTTPGYLVAGLTAGLGECGDATDVPLLIRLAGREPMAWENGDAGATPPWPAVVRRAAVRALGRLAKPGDLPRLLVPLMADATPSVAREAIDALVAVAAEVPDEDAESALRRPEPPVRNAALRLIRACGPWRRLETDLVLAADSRTQVADEARSDLRSWLRQQHFSRPEPERMRRLRALVAAVDLPDGMRRHIAALLRGAPG